MAQINKPNEYFNTKLYTGTNATQSITGVGFQPDFSWFKTRSASNGHTLIDSVRGITKRLASHDTSAEITQSDMLESFDTDGFTLGADSNDYTNWNGSTWVAWNWLAGGTASSNTDGSITSTVSANTTSGFSIVSYTGTGANATVGHGLGSKPKFIIIKSRDKVDDWHCYNETIGATKVIWLNSTSAPASTSTFMQDTEPTSSVFSLGTNTATNTSGFDHIAYCFAEKKGFSKFGSFVGNGSSDGSFIYLGFKPAFLMIKGTQNLASATPDWRIRDNKTNTYNPVTTTLYANSSGAEVTEDNHDLLSNGFKVRTSGAENNYSGETYIYMAFAENPLVGTNNTPATAR